jgi:hypothetical protein
MRYYISGLTHHMPPGIMSSNQNDLLTGDPYVPQKAQQKSVKSLNGTEMNDRLRFRRRQRKSQHQKGQLFRPMINF